MKGKRLKLTRDQKTEMGMRIRTIRIYGKMGTEEFSKLINVSAATVSQWETGQTSPMRERVIKVAEVTNQSAKWIVKGEGELNQNWINEQGQQELHTDYPEINKEPEPDQELIRHPHYLAKRLKDTVIERNDMKIKLDSLQSKYNKIHALLIKESEQTINWKARYLSCKYDMPDAQEQLKEALRQKV